MAADPKNLVRKLQDELSSDYKQYSPTSQESHDSSKKHLVDGGSHSLRLIHPFPPLIVKANGAYVHDEDGHRILDFWQGHHANILGHNPEVILSALTSFIRPGSGLITGFVDPIQAEVAQLLCQCTGTEKVRLTTSGSLATMYAIMLAKAYTDRDIVMKIGGGWHGAHPWGLKGVKYAPGGAGFDHLYSSGLPSTIDSQVLVTRFNDSGRLVSDFKEHGDKIACLIIEPFIGAGGFLPADMEYIRTARELTHRHGAALILDEVISGFRFRAGGTSSYYGIEPDLFTLGKIIGGGMPVAAVAGKKRIMDFASKGGSVSFSGGTFSAHPACLVAAKAMLDHLCSHQEEIYPRLESMGLLLKETVEKAFASEGIAAHCTGYSNDALPDSSITMLVFPHDADARINSPDQIYNPEVCDLYLGNEGIQLALLLEDIHVVHGLGSLTTAHTEMDINLLGDACKKAARRFKRFR